MESRLLIQGYDGCVAIGEYATFAEVILLCSGREQIAGSLKNSYARTQNCERRVLALSYLFVCPYVRLPVNMEQLGSHWTHFHEILYLIIFSQSHRENSSFIKM